MQVFFFGLSLEAGNALTNPLGDSTKAFFLVPLVNFNIQGLSVQSMWPGRKLSVDEGGAFGF
jgi:hypothetical protein